MKLLIYICNCIIKLLKIIFAGVWILFFITFGTAFLGPVGLLIGIGSFAIAIFSEEFWEDYLSNED